MKKFFSVLLSIIFAVCLLATLLLAVVRFNFSYSSITKMVSEMMKPVAAAPVMDDGLFHPGDVKLSLAGYEEYGDFGDFDFSSFDFSQIDLSNMDVNEIVGSYLEMAGVEIEPETLAEIIASPEVSDFVDKYVGEIVDYVTGVTDELDIKSDDVLKVMNKSLDVYEEKTGEKIDRTGMKEAIETSVAEAKVQVQASLDVVKEENAENLAYLEYVNLVLSLKLFLICVGVCLILAGIILLINQNVFVWLKYVFLPCFIDGLIIFIVALVAGGIVPGILKAVIADYQLPRGVYEGIWSIVSTLITQMKIYGAVSAILGIALFVLGVTLGKKKAAAAAAPVEA